jgi:nucleoside recognition membrane protein YjiH
MNFSTHLTTSIYNLFFKVIKVTTETIAEATTDITTKKSHSLATILTFIVPSLIGLLLFMTPISYQDAITIPIAIIAKGLLNLLGDSITSIVMVIVLFTALMTIVNKVLTIPFIQRSDFLKSLLNVSPI